MSVLSIRQIFKAFFQPFYRVLIHTFYLRDVTTDLLKLKVSSGTVLKYFLWQKILCVNKHVPWPVHFTTQVIDPHKIKRGTKFPGFSICCFIDGRNGIEFGKNTWVGPRVTIISQDHDNFDYTVYKCERPIVIGDNCLLTSNCVILPGVQLGPHTIVASGSVVTKSFLEGDQIIGGVPAKIIKKIPPYTKLEQDV